MATSSWSAPAWTAPTPKKGAAGDTDAEGGAAAYADADGGAAINADVDGDAAINADVGGSAVDDTDSDTGAEGVADAEAVGVDDCVVGAGVEGTGLVGDVVGTGVGLAADVDGDGAGELVGDATEVGRAEGDPEAAADVTGTEG